MNQNNTAAHNAPAPTSSDAGRWISYSLAAAAGMGAFAQQSEGDIVYSGIQDISIDQFNAINLNIDGDAYNDILLKNYVFFGGNYQGVSVNYAPGKVVGFNAGLSYASALSFGDLIDADATAGGPFAASMAYGSNNPNAQFNSVTNAYIGLEFPGTSASRGGSASLFAWIRVSIDNDAGTFIVHDWAYERNAGQGIQAGVVPAPGTLGFLAAGAAGLQSLRRRRKA